MRLDDDRFLEVIRTTPLVAIDLIVRDHEGKVLMGLRRNEPAKGTWFVPGGRILNGETLDAAFERITECELGVRTRRDEAPLLEVFDAIYDTNYRDVESLGTHYVVIAYELSRAIKLVKLPADQQGHYRYFAMNEAVNEIQGGKLHPNNLPFLTSDQIAMVTQSLASMKNI